MLGCADIDFLEAIMKNRLVIINQHEEGVIRYNDPVFYGLLTFGLDTCVAVVISDSEKGIQVLQHHDISTDAASITDVIKKYSMHNPVINLIINSAWTERNMGLLKAIP